MEIKDVISVLETLVEIPKGDAVSEEMCRKLNYQISEYKRQESHLQEIFKKEQLDLSDYISMKIARLEVLSEMIDGITIKRNQLEDAFKSTENVISKKTVV